MNSQQALAGIQHPIQAGLTPQAQMRTGKLLGWGQDGAQTKISRGLAWSLRDLSTPGAKEKPNSGFPHEAKHTKGSWNSLELNRLGLEILQRAASTVVWGHRCDYWSLISQFKKNQPTSFISDPEGDTVACPHTLDVLHFCLWAGRWEEWAGHVNST